jgi:hypothetical protein
MGAEVEFSESKDRGIVVTEPGWVLAEYNWDAVHKLLHECFAYMETRIELIENHAVFAKLGFHKSRRNAA